MTSSLQKYIPLVDLAGKILSQLQARLIPVDRSKSSKAPELSHLLMVVDRSGSMYGDMAAMRAMIRQVLTLKDFENADLLISLVSYSGTGDVKTHFTRVRVGDIMKPSSKEQGEIEKLQATYLTCISGGLATAEKLVQPGEPTCLLVHTDGYANDPSPYAETKAINAILDRLSKMSNVVVNTIVYSWGDFSLLDMIASRCGGTCVQAKTTKDVHTAIQNSVAQMAGRQTPAVLVVAEGLIVAFSKNARKVLTGFGELYLRGLSEIDDVTVFSVGTPVKGTLDLDTIDPEMALALARVELSQGKLNLAKQYLLGSRDSSLYEHLRALTGAQIGAFAAALEKAIFDNAHVYVEKFGVASDRPTIIEILNLLNANTEGFQVHMPTLRTGYQKRSISKVAGKREDDGTLTKPNVRTANKSAEWQSVGSFNPNETTATVNMMVKASQSLFKGDTEITEVAGIPISLTAFNNYTLIGDGSANVPVLRIRVTDKKLGKRLADLGFAPANSIVDIPLKDLDVVPVGDVGAELVEDLEIVNKLIAVKTVASMLNAAMKGQSDTYTPEQVAALKEYYLSPALNASIPSTNHFADRKEAIEKGLIDSYTVYKIELGTPAIPTLSSLYGANDLVKRYLEISVDGKKVDKPSMLDVVNPKATFKAKAVKTPNAEDAVQKPFFDQFVGIESKGPWNDFLATMGMDDDDIAEFLGWRNLSVDRRVEVFKDLSKRVAEFNKNLFAQTLSPTVMYMGATGFLPDAIEATMLTPEDFATRHKLKLPKALLEATFFELPDGRVLSVRPETAWFTTPAGIASLKEPVAEE